MEYNCLVWNGKTWNLYSEPRFWNLYSAKVRVRVEEWGSRVRKRVRVEEWGSRVRKRVEGAELRRRVACERL
jgi:hypothetical protein